MALPKTTEQWLHALFGAMIGGAATAGSGVLGSAAIGQPMNWKQLGSCLVGAAVAAACMYLKQSPLPPPDGADNSTPTKTP